MAHDGVAVSTLRWLTDPPLDGVTNMARDEALLERVGRGLSAPTLRFYSWASPTISLGYFQSYQEYAALAGPAGDLPAVRRLTGGGAILHDQELTYSLTLPLDHLLIAGRGPNHLYDHVHGAFAALLTEHGVPVTRGPAGGNGCSQRGPFFCFARHACFDLLTGGAKLMGSAQRRTTRAVLQHGSLVIDRRFDQQPGAALAAYIDVDLDTYLPQLADMIAGAPVGEAGSWSAGELEEADRLGLKYGSREWTGRR